MTDFIINMNTRTGDSSFTTKEIKGMLHSIILDSPDFVSVEISSEFGYPLFKKLSHVGTSHVLIRYPCDGPDGNQYTEHVDKMCLNEKLIIRVQGKENVDIKITLRYY